MFLCIFRGLACFPKPGPLFLMPEETFIPLFMLFHSKHLSNPSVMVGEEGLWKAKEKSKTENIRSSRDGKKALPSIFSLHFPCPPKSIVNCSFLLPFLNFSHTDTAIIVLHLSGGYCLLHPPR